MSLLRKTLKATAITLGVLTVACSLLWYKFSDNISPEMWRHAENAWHGNTPITGDRTPGELIRYAKRRLEGHPNLEAIALPPLHWAQARVERPVPPGPLPTLGKGQQTQPLPRLPGQNITSNISVGSAQEFITAVTQAHAGQTITLAPGTYRINTNLITAAAGSAFQRITVRAAQPGQVHIEFNAQEGFKVSHPYWVFENLNIRGVCGQHSSCEHAFHVVGKASYTVIRNNHIEDYNAHLKVNGADSDWPDNGLVQYNTLTNTKPRATNLPVTPIDIVGASQWHLEDNLISNFVKGDGDQISYGLFMKGAGSGGRIERNLVICTPKDISQPGVRVGLSFGGGGTGKPYCRDRRCVTEHTGGLAANNIIAHCNDSGIDVNNATQITLAHNTLINTGGIDIRRRPADARLYGNLLEGYSRARDGAKLRQEMNQTMHSAAVFDNGDQLRLGWRNKPDNIPSMSGGRIDFCGLARNDGTPPGATTAPCSTPMQ